MNRQFKTGYLSEETKRLQSLLCPNLPSWKTTRVHQDSGKALNSEWEKLWFCRTDSLSQILQPKTSASLTELICRVELSQPLKAQLLCVLCVFFLYLTFIYPGKLFENNFSFTTMAWYLWGCDERWELSVDNKMSPEAERVTWRPPSKQTGSFLFPNSLHICRLSCFVSCSLW